MSLSVEERLRRYADDLDTATTAAQVRASDATTSALLPFRNDQSTPATHNVRRVLVAATALVLIVGAVTVLVRRESMQHTATYPALDSHWVVPGPVSGFHLWYAQSLDSGLSYQERYRVLVARRSTDGGFIEPVTVTLGARWRIWIDEERVGSYAPEATQVAGTTGEFVEDSLNHSLVLQYEVGDGDVVVLGMRNPGPESRRMLLELAELVAPDSDSSLAVSAQLPSDYEVLAAMPMHHFFGTAPLLTFIDNESRTSIIDIETEAASPPSNYELFKMRDLLEPAEVRGVTGWFTTDSTSPTGSISGSLFWRERSGVVVTLSANRDLSTTAALKADLLKIANELQPVSESDWRDFAAKAEETGTGVGELAGPTQVAFPTTPDGYQLKQTQLGPVGSPYGMARYEPIDPSSGLPTIEVRLHTISPEEWDRMLATELAGGQRAQANGRMLIDTGGGLDTPDNPSQRAAAFEWVTNVIVEIVVSRPDGAPSTSTFSDLVELAQQVNRVTFLDGPEGAPPSGVDGTETTVLDDTLQTIADPPGVITYATTDSANSVWPTVATSGTPANNHGFGMVLCDDSVWTKFASLQTSDGLPLYTYSGTLCASTTVNEVAVGSVATCAAVTGGIHYARCQRLDDTETGIAADHADDRDTTVVLSDDPPMAIEPTSSDAEQLFGASLSAAGSVDSYTDDTVDVRLSAGERASSTCFEMSFATFASTGCLEANLLSTGLAYAAFQHGSGPIELVGIVPDDVATIEVAGVIVPIRYNVWHYSAPVGSDLTLTVRSADSSRSATV